jgi:hypothetical protein
MALVGPVGQLVSIGELQLAQDRRDVALDRLGRDLEFRRNVAVGIATGDEAQHLALSRRQEIEIRIDVTRLEVLSLEGERVKHESGKTRGEDSVARCHPIDGV